MLTVLLRLTIMLLIRVNSAKGGVEIIIILLRTISWNSDFDLIFCTNVW